MPRSIDRSFQVLTGTSNLVADEVLIAALDSRYAVIRESAVRALLARESLLGKLELLRRWRVLDTASQTAIASAGDAVSGALRQSLLGSDALLRRNALELIVKTRNYDLAPLLIGAAEEPLTEFGDGAARALLELAELLFADAAKQPIGKHLRELQFVRRTVAAALEMSVRRFPNHQREEIVESYLLLADGRSAVLKTLMDGGGASSNSILKIMRTSNRPGVIRRLLGSLDDPSAPPACLEILAERTDASLLTPLLEKVAEPIRGPLRRNLRKMDSLGWTDPQTGVLDRLTGRQQSAAVRWATSSGMNQSMVLGVLRMILEQGKPEGRRAAADALTPFEGAEADQLVLEALENEDPHVQAIIVHQLRRRKIPNAASLLVDRLARAHPVVRQAAANQLEEFNVRRFLETFEAFSDEVRASTGELVRKIDPATLQVLMNELKSESRIRRLRALEAAPLLEAVPLLQTPIRELLTDQDHILRAAATHALGWADSPENRQALRERLLDSHFNVRLAAQRSLQRLAGANNKPVLTSAVWWSLALQADSARIVELGRQFRRGGYPIAWNELLLLAACLAAIGGGVWLFARRLQGRDKKRHCPRGLFNELCRAHGLRWRERRLLHKLAIAQDVTPTALIFLDPDRFPADETPSDMGSAREATAQVKEKLFGAKAVRKP